MSLVSLTRIYIALGFPSRRQQASQRLAREWVALGILVACMPANGQVANLDDLQRQLDEAKKAQRAAPNAPASKAHPKTVDQLPTAPGSLGVSSPDLKGPVDTALNGCWKAERAWQYTADGTKKDVPSALSCVSLYDDGRYVSSCGTPARIFGYRYRTDNDKLTTVMVSNTVALPLGPSAVVEYKVEGNRFFIARQYAPPRPDGVVRFESVSLRIVDTASEPKCSPTILSGAVSDVPPIANSSAKRTPSLEDVEAAVQQDHYSQAESMLGTVVTSHPDSARAHYLYAQVLAHNGNFKRAVKEAALARQFDPAISFTSAEKFRAFEQFLRSNP